LAFYKKNREILVFIKVIQKEKMLFWHLHHSLACCCLFLMMLREKSSWHFLEPGWFEPSLYSILGLFACLAFAGVIWHITFSHICYISRTLNIFLMVAVDSTRTFSILLTRSMTLMWMHHVCFLPQVMKSHHVMALVAWLSKN